jgi:hypothetical protein
MFNHQPHPFSAFQLNEEQNKMLQKIIMTAANISHLCNIVDAM